MAELEINNTQELTEKLNEIVKDPSINKPTEEEVAQAKADYENAAKEWKETIYKIGTPEDAQEICDYVKHFIMNRCMWKENAWMGVIKLAEEIDAATVLFKGKKDKGLELGYQAAEFTFYILSNPGGIGLQSALDFEAEHEIYFKTLNLFGQTVQEAREALKNIEFLQQRWGAMAQGFYLEMEPEAEITEESVSELFDPGVDVEEPPVE